MPQLSQYGNLISGLNNYPNKNKTSNKLSKLNMVHRRREEKREVGRMSILAAVIYSMKTRVNHRRAVIQSCRAVRQL
jgi:hypothetical protein